MQGVQDTVPEEDASILELRKITGFTQVFTTFISHNVLIR